MTTQRTIATIVAALASDRIPDCQLNRRVFGIEMKTHHVIAPVSKLYMIRESMSAFKSEFTSFDDDRLVWRRMKRHPVMRISTAVESARPRVNIHYMRRELLLVLLDPSIRKRRTVNFRLNSVKLPNAIISPVVTGRKNRSLRRLLQQRRILAYRKRRLNEKHGN